MTQHTVTLRAALIGDVIGSRQAEDREKLQHGLRGGLAEVNETVSAVQPLTVTLGDEFQGAYRSLAEAVQASLLLQSSLLGVADIRVGMGWGELYFGDERSPLDQDGPCWWRARDALNSVEEGSRRHGVPQSKRTACVTGTSADERIGGYLLLRDHVVSRMDTVDGMILRGISRGESQKQLAEELGLNKSSVSRRVQSHGLQALILSLPGDVALMTPSS